MSTDRELLELAAKAVGARPYVDRAWPGLCLSDDPECGPFSVNEDGNAARDWNPLESDGDALRLAVKLGLRLTLPKYHRFGTTAEPQVETTPGHTVFRDDPMQQTREAIVNTAAEIGRAIP